MDIVTLLSKTIELGGSDLHLKVDSPPRVRVDGELLPLEHPALTDEDTELVLRAVSERTPKKLEHFLQTGDLDTAYSAPGVGRFRVNGFRQKGSISFAFRYVPTQVPTLESLGLPPGVTQLAEHHRGLVLVTGITGSGKTTSLAAMINHINQTRRAHVVTLEDPIEIVHQDQSCIVQQREIGLDVDSFNEGMRRVLRQDPDVILVGELRDEESARTALQAGESGHLVVSTMHTLDAMETIGRMIELFPPDKQLLVRQIMANVLQGVISQRLIPQIGGGRVAACEVMINTARIADMIRDPNKTDGITKAIEEGAIYHMQTFQQHLVQLVLDEVVHEEIAASAATNRHDFELSLGRALRSKQAAGVAAAQGGEGDQTYRGVPGASSLKVA
jgi:twitching motility protein PilT